MHCTEDSKDTLAGLVLLVENRRKKLWLAGTMVCWCLSSIMIPAASNQLALATSCSLQLAEPILASTTSSPLKVVTPTCFWSYQGIPPVKTSESIITQQEIPSNQSS